MQLSEQLEQRLVVLARSYPRPQSALAQAVNLLRETGPGFDECAVKRLAELCCLSQKDVEAFLDFYPAQRPVRSGVASVCTGIVCYLNGASDICGRLRAEPSLDGVIIEEVVETGCMGACYAAPVVRLGEGTHSRS